MGKHNHTHGWVNQLRTLNLDGKTRRLYIQTGLEILLNARSVGPVYFADAERDHPSETWRRVVQGLKDVGWLTSGGYLTSEGLDFLNQFLETTERPRRWKSTAARKYPQT